MNTRQDTVGTTSASGSLSCSLVKELIGDWAKRKDRPFPYLIVGDHLRGCLSCLAWSTSIAFRPADYYVRALRLKLSELLSFLGSSLLAVWAQNQDVKISFCVEPESLPQARRRALEFLARYESFSPATKQRAASVREMITHAGVRHPSQGVRHPGQGAGTPLARLEPYELVRYFFQTALQLAPDSEQRLSLLTNLGITENYQALSERHAGHAQPTREHFCRARDYLNRVVTEDHGPYKGTAAQTRESDKTAMVSARINLAGTEVQEADYSEASLHKAIGLLFEARRMVVELGLRPADFTAIYSNLLISYLRLYLDRGVEEGIVQAEHLARDVCSAPDLARAFLDECIRDNADPELSQLLSEPRITDLAQFLRQQAQCLVAQSQPKPSN